MINGGVSLKGEVQIGGAKNAAVAIIPATILADGPCVLENIPNISDVSIILKILHEIGASVKMRGKNTVEIDTRHQYNLCVVGHISPKLVCFFCSYYLDSADSKLPLPVFSFLKEKAVYFLIDFDHTKF